MATFARPAAGAKKRNGVDRDMPAEAGFALDVAGGVEGPMVVMYTAPSV